MTLDVSRWLDKHHANGIQLGMKELLYYQSKTSLISLEPRRTVQAKLAGSYLTKMKGRGMEFDEARHYQPGDDIRAIDWRVTARTGKTHTKLFREEKERPVFLVVDLSNSMHFGTQLLFKSVQAAHLASLVAWCAAKRGDRIGGLVFNQQEHREFKPMTRQKAVLSLLNGLRQMHQPHATNNNEHDSLTEACARIRRLAHPGSIVIMISDFLNFSEKAQQHINRVARHCEVLAYRVSDVFEHQLPHVKTPQIVSITDGVNKQSFTLGAKKQAQAYEKAHQQEFDEVKRRLQQSLVQVIDVSAASPLEAQLNPMVK